MPRFLFFRHAQSHNNAVRKTLDEEWGGSVAHIRPLEARKRQPDPDLTEVGVKQSQLLGTVLPQMCRGKTLVACSPFLRTLRTLEPSLDKLRLRTGIDVLCHGLLFELGGCYHMKQVYAGLSQAEISKWISSQEHVHEQGWFYDYFRRETKSEYVHRVDRVVHWIYELLDSDYETIVFMTHGAFMARVIRAILSIPDDVWITHANTAYTSMLWDKEHGFLLEGINQKSHIPYALQCGDSPADGWWPAIYKRESVFHALDCLPQKHPVLYEEIISTRSYISPKEVDDRSVFFIHFDHHSLCAWVQYDPKTNTTYDLMNKTAERVDIDFEDFVFRYVVQNRIE